MKKRFVKGLLFVTALAAMTPVTTFAKGNEILASSDTKVISEKKIEKLSDWELRAARYEITARHGKEVYSEDMKEYFEGTGWYQPAESYDPTCLSEIEKQNLDALYREDLSRRQEDAKERFEENQRISESGDVQVMSSSYVYIESPLYYEDMVGTWVDNTDPDYPTVLKIWEDNGNFYGHYSWFSPGNENGIGFANTYTEWGKWDGYLDVTYENGYLSFHNTTDPASTVFANFQYDVMNDSLVEISSYGISHTFTKDDTFEYTL